MENQKAFEKTEDKPFLVELKIPAKSILKKSNLPKKAKYVKYLPPLLNNVLSLTALFGMNILSKPTTLKEGCIRK
jgi:hypothetical protein